MQVMSGYVGCRQCEEREFIQRLSQCLDVIVANMDKDAQLWGDLFVKLNGIIVQLENKLRVIDGQ